MPTHPTRRALPTGGVLLVGPALALALVACSSDPPARRAADPTPTPSTTGASVAPTEPGAPTPRATSPSPRAGTTPSPADSLPVDPLSPRPPLETAPPPGLPTCSPAALAVTDADAVYTADYVQELFTVRTTGPDCQLPGGYPASVAVLDASGAPLGPVAQGGFDLPAPSGVAVTLSRATSLSFFVATRRDVGCPQAAGLVVTLPGTTTPLRTATSMPVCGGALATGPVQRLGDQE